MNKTTGMLGLFTAGVVVGAFAMRWLGLPDAVSQETSVPTPPAPLAHEAASVAAPVQPANANANAAAPPLILPASSVAPVSAPRSAPDAPASEPLLAKASPFATPIDSGSVQPIDVGERLRKHIDRPSQPGHENEIGDAHRALEREPRDDGWAYSMEAELQNSMLNEVSMGGFKVEGVECRSTLCEVRISGATAQSDSVKRWQDSLVSQPFGQRLFMNYGSTFSDTDRVDAIFIFRRPKKPQ